MNSVMPIIDTSNLKIISYVYSTGGTVKYDFLSKANTGLRFPVSVDYVKKNSA